MRKRLSRSCRQSSLQTRVSSAASVERSWLKERRFIESRVHQRPFAPSLASVKDIHTSTLSSRGATTAFSKSRIILMFHFIPWSLSRPFNYCGCLSASTLIVILCLLLLLAFFSILPLLHCFTYWNHSTIQISALIETYGNNYFVMLM